jgi:regulator of cell morphogenesis and NO signaling
MTTDTLDVRDLAPRDRHQTIFDRLGQLEPGQTMTLVNDHDPIPLRYQLDAEQPDQFRWEYRESGPERWVVDITNRARVFDARPILAAGEKPFAAIMESAATVGGDEIFVVYAPFEPVPLEAVLGEQGFSHIADQIDEETWRVTFLRP